MDFDVPVWCVPMDAPWEGSLDALTDLVRRSAVKGVVSDDHVDEEIPGEGYSFTVSGIGPRVAVVVRVAAGNTAVGRRMPRRRLSVQLSATTDAGVDARAADAVCGEVVATLEPASAAFADTAVRHLARRGNWKIGIGYRTWISSGVGRIDQLAEGLTKSELASGTMIASPDDWGALTHLVRSDPRTASVNILNSTDYIKK